MKHSLISLKEQLSNYSIYRKIYILALLVLAIGLPLSSVLVSISQFMLLGVWLVEGNFKDKFSIIKNNKSLWAFLALPAIHIIWLINTTDFSYAIHDLKIKIPLLIFPLVLGTIPVITKKELRLVLYAFVFGVFSGTVVVFGILTDIYHVDYHNIREVSIFVSHIRFGLMILLSMLITGYHFVILYKKLSIWSKISAALLFVWLFVYLVILQSITSWVAFLFIMLFLFFTNYKNIKRFSVRVTLWFILFLFFIVSIGIVSKAYYDFYYTKTVDFSELPQRTPRGNKYLNDTLSTQKENGYYVRVQISYRELAETWPKLSDIPIKGKDANGYSIRNTIIRYLTSKGLPKDRDGLLALKPVDIKMIENGFANCNSRNKFSPYVKVYNIIWEIDRYKNTANANNKSIVQRIEFGKAAIKIISENFWFGVGTGDLAIAYKKAYIDMDSNLKAKNRLRAHNQFLTFFVSFGLFGFLLAMLSILYPAFKNVSRKNILLSGFLLMIFISMFNEDTLETQAGVTFYIVFYTLLIFSKSEIND